MAGGTLRDDHTFACRCYADAAAELRRSFIERCGVHLADRQHGLSAAMSFADT